MSAQLNIYGTGPGGAGTIAVPGGTLTVPAGQRAKITKLQATMAGPGSVLLQVGGNTVFSFWFWASGQQSEDNFMWTLPAGSVIAFQSTQAVAAAVTAWAGGLLELTNSPV